MSKKKRMTLGEYYEGYDCPLCKIDLGYAMELVEYEEEDKETGKMKKVHRPRIGIARLPNGMMYCRACAWLIRKVCH